MKTKADYTKLQSDLAALEKTTKLYLADECVDVENVLEGRPEDAKRYHETNIRDDDPLWGDFYRAAGMAAGMRAEEAGLNINDMLGYVVY